MRKMIAIALKDLRIRFSNPIEWAFFLILPVFFSLIIGGSTGGGTLKFKGKSYDFKIGGLSVGATVGIAKVAAVGEVYDLKDVSKFPGTYTALNAAIALGGGVGGVQMKNENGVIMRLESRTKGLRFNLSTSGVTVTMEK